MFYRVPSEFVVDPATENVNRDYLGNFKGGGGAGILICTVPCRTCSLF